MNLRQATLQDSDLLFDWRARDEVASPWWRGVPVSREQHERWFLARVNNPAVRLWIAESDGQPVGDARLDSNGEVTFNTLPAFRGRGVGTEILREATRLAVADGWTRVKAAVDEDNIASQKTLAKAGFKYRPDVLFFRYPE